MSRLIACSSCHQHVKSHEPSCPLCGARLRDAQGRALRTASAVLMGLTLSACGEKDVGETSSSATETATATSTTAGPGTSTSASQTSEPYGGAVDPAYGGPASTNYSDPYPPTTMDTSESSTTDGTTGGFCSPV